MLTHDVKDRSVSHLLLKHLDLKKLIEIQIPRP